MSEGSVRPRYWWRMAMLGAAAIWGTASAEARPVNVAPNAAFEAGATAPRGWSLQPGASWASGGARSGNRSLEARTVRAERVCSSLVALEAEQSYRLDGWLRVRRGRARLGIEARDGGGAVVATAATPWVRPGSGWQFTAVEQDMPPHAASGYLWWEVEGEARLDDVVLAPMKTNLVYNPSFDADARGRIGMWGEETEPLLPGERAGRLASNAAGGRRGPALQLEAGPSAWFGSRVVMAMLPPGITAYRCSGWSRPESGEAQIRVLWLDAAEKIIGADVIPVAGREGAWQRHEGPARAPAEARYATVAAIVQGGAARFDDFSLMAAAPAREKTPVVQVLVNQVGYETRGPKSAVVATNFFPTDGMQGWLEIHSAAGRSVHRVPITAARIHDGDSADWGSYFWRGDFTSLRRPGRYRAVAVVGGERGQSYPFTIGDRVLLRSTGQLGVEFFFVQRCGFEVPGWHKACHLDDARLPDGTPIDAVGGWHSAGDYNKLIYENGDGGVAYALLKAYDALPDYFRAHDRDRDGRPDILDEALWGARFVAKMQNPRTGGLYKDIRQGPGRNWTKWSPPDVHTDNQIGTEDDPVIDPGEGSSPLVPAVWVRLGKMLDERGERNDFPERARRYWQYLTKDGATGSPHLLLVALDLHALTGESAFLEYARRTAETLVGQQVQSGRHQGAWGSSGEIVAGALASFALARPKDPLVPKIQRALTAFRVFLESTADNPFGLSKQSVGEKEYFFEPTSTLGLNFNQLQKAWAAALIYRVNRDERALRIAADQIDWVLGKNPYNLCQFEGAGSFNPPRYHHRYDSIPGRERGAVPGAIPNGFVRNVAGEDSPGFDMSHPAPGKRRVSYRTSEPWLVHNMWYLMALSALPN